MSIHTISYPAHCATISPSWHTCCIILPAMKAILLCSSNALLTKNIYGILRDRGYAVETVEHPALAVKKVLWAHYDFVIVDSEPFGMSAQEAAQVINSVSPGLPVVVMGDEHANAGGSAAPLDLEDLKRTIHSIAA